MEVLLETVADALDRGDLHAARGALQAVGRAKHVVEQVAPLLGTRRLLDGEQIAVQLPQVLFELTEEDREQALREEVLVHAPLSLPSMSRKRVLRTLRSRLARSICRVEARLCVVTWLMSRMACWICDTPSACCEAEAATCTAACAESETRSAMSPNISPASATAC